MDTLVISACGVLVLIAVFVIRHWLNKNAERKILLQTKREEKRLKEENSIKVVVGNSIGLPLDTAAALLGSVGIYYDANGHYFCLPDGFWTCNAQRAHKAKTIMTLVNNYIRTAMGRRPSALIADDMMRLFQSSLKDYPGQVIAVICELAISAGADNSRVLDYLIPKMEDLIP